MLLRRYYVCNGLTFRSAGESLSPDESRRTPDKNKETWMKSINKKKKTVY